MRGEFHAWRRAVVLAAVGLIVAAGTAQANVPLTRVSTDPFTNPTSQHATEVEPDTFAHRQHRRRGVPGRPLLRRRRDRHRLRAAPATAARPGRARLPAGPDVQRRRRRQPVRARQRRERRLRRRARRLADLLDPAPADTSRADRLRQPLDRRRPRRWSPPVSDPAAGGEVGRPRQELDGVRQPPGEPVLRPLLHRVRQLRRGRPRADEHVDRRRRRPGACRSRPPGTTRASAASRSCSRTARVVVPFESLNGKIAAFPSDDGGASWTKGSRSPGIRFHGVAGGLRTSPLPTAEIAGDGTRLRRLGGLPLPGKCCAERHRVLEVVATACSWSDAGPGADRPGHQQRRPLHPRPGGRPGHVGREHAPRADLLLLSRRRLRRRLPARRRLHLLARRRRALGRRRRSSPGRWRSSEIAQTSQGPMVGDYISTSFSGGTATTLFAVGRDAAGGPRSTRRCTPRPRRCRSRRRRRRPTRRAPPARTRSPASAPARRTTR